MKFRIHGKASTFSLRPSSGSFKPLRLQLFSTWGRAWANSRVEHQQYHEILERLLQCARAQVGALVIADDTQPRFIFRSAIGLQCQESSLGNLTWSWEGKLLMHQHKISDQPFAFSKQDIEHHPRFAFEKMLGFHSLCFQPLSVDTRILGGVLLGNRRGTTNFLSSDLTKLFRVAKKTSPVLERLLLYRELKEVFIHSVRAFASAIDAKDPYTHGHSERVTDYALKVAATLGWNEETRDDLRISAILHDIGKIGIAESILSKPASLTPEEYMQIKRHPEIGAKIIGEIPQLKACLTGILSHHERFDGNGYPQSLGGFDIPIFGRLIAVTDAFDAMTSDRPYRKGFSREAAITELLTQQSKQFDPDMVKAFLSTLNRGAII
jgi:HD-GYP domain-containing protein (c-di-GMP phosphodiesterase class II)